LFLSGSLSLTTVVSLPVTILNSPSVVESSQPQFSTAADILGVIICIVGWLLETYADFSKVSNFVQGASPATQLSEMQFCYSRFVVFTRQLSLRGMCRIAFGDSVIT